MARSCKLNVLTRLLFIWGQLASPSWSQSQPLINQLAVLFRARPAWPTSFHSDPNANQNLIGDTDGANSINYSDNDLTNLNDLLTSGSLDSQQNTISGSSTGPEGSIVRANSFYISSSTPPIIVKDSTGTKPKGVLIAHPVLGPNQLSMNPEHKYNFQQHRPQGSTKVKLISTGGIGGGLYASMNGGQNSGSSMVVPSLQSLISEGLKNHMKSHRQSSKMKHFIQGALGGSNNNHNNKYPQLIAVQGTPPSGARVIAIPIPSKIPFNPNLNNNGLQYVDTSQQNQPGPLNYYSTGQNNIAKIGPTFGSLQSTNGNGFTQNQNQLQQQNSGQVQQSFQQNTNNFANNLQQNPHQHFQHQNTMPQQSFQQNFANNNFPQSQLALPQNIYLQNQNTNHQIQQQQQQQQQNQQPLIQSSFPLSMQNLHQPQNPQSFQQYQSQSPYFGGGPGTGGVGLTTPQPQFTPVNSLFNPSPLDFSSPITSASTTTTTRSPSTSPPTNKTTTMTTTSASTTTTTTTSPTTTTTIASTTTTTPQTTTTPWPSYHHNNSPYTSSPYSSKFMTPSYPEYNAFQPTTQPPWRHYTSNNIQEVIVKSNSQIAKNQGSPPGSFHSSPSTLIGTFRYPDPPSPPQLQSLNTYHELPTFQTYATKSPQQLYNSYTDLKKKKKDSRGYFEPSISPVSPFAPTGNSNSLSEASNTIQVSSGFGSTGSSRNSKWNKYNEGSHIVKPNLFQTKSITVSSEGNTGKQTSDDGSFRPSPQLHSFEDSTSGLKEYITVNPPSLSNRDSKSLQISDDLPAMESGFRPFNHFAFVNGVPGASISTTTETSVLNLIRNEFLKEMKSGQIRQWSEVDPTGSTPSKTKTRHERQYNTGPSSSYSNNGNYNSYTTNQYNNNPSTSANPPTYSSFPTTNSFSNSNTIRYTTSTANPLSDQWVGRMASSSSGGGGHYSHSSPHRTQSSTTTSSSELYEDWLAPKRESNPTFTPSTTTTKRPIYFTLGKTKNPLECEKFHRFGFCPVTSQYPLEQVEAIGTRCSTLLSHLVAPLPQTDVRYDVIVPKNGSHVKGRSAAPSGWSWKTFSGKPVCDTKEIKIVPGWAKNEQGEWLVILQSEKWKQEAQISLCTSQGTHYCEPSDGEKCEEKAPRSTKCVQRFTAQRLVVLDPYDQDRCPVVRSVFLPSACVCLNDDRNSHKKHHHNHSSKHHHHHSNNNHEINNNNGHSSSSHKKSHKKTGRSLSTAFFGLGNDVELETAADSSTSVETSKPLVVKEIPTARSASSTSSTSEKTITTSSSTSSPSKDTSSSGSEEDIPVISIRNPLNATVMVVTSEKASSDEGSASTESSVESSSNSNSDKAISTSSSITTTVSTSKPLFSSSSTSSTSSLGAAFIDSSRENSTESSSSSSSKSEENET